MVARHCGRSGSAMAWWCEAGRGEAGPVSVMRVCVCVGGGGWRLVVPVLENDLSESVTCPRSKADLRPKIVRSIDVYRNCPNINDR